MSKPFLPEEERDQIERDITAMVHDLPAPTYASNGASRQITLRFNTAKLVKELTAYVDKKVEEYY